MPNMKYICFQDKDELLDVDGEIEVYPLGQLVFSILDIDWSECLHTAEQLRRRINTMPLSLDRTLFAGFENPDEAVYCIVAEYYQSLVGLFKKDYPCLFRLFSAQSIVKTLAMYEAAYETADKNKERFDEIRRTGDMLIAADFTVRIFEAYPEKPDWLEGYGHIGDSQVVTVTLQFVDHLVESLRAIDAFQKRLTNMIEFALDVDSQYSELKPAQRLYLMQATDFEPYKECEPLYEKLSIKRRSLNNDTLMLEPGVPITKEALKTLKDTKLSTATFYCSDDICALAFLEFEHMCTMNGIVRRCGHCDRYFLSFTKNARYCDRIANREQGRTCKNVAAMAKYLDGIRADEARKLYRRNANTYQMRCSRAPACYPRAAYEDWLDEAKAHVDAYNRGEMDFQQLEERIRIPDAR